jgi:serine protease Do
MKSIHSWASRCSFGRNRAGTRWRPLRRFCRQPLVKSYQQSLVTMLLSGLAILVGISSPIAAAASNSDDSLNARVANRIVTVRAVYGPHRTATGSAVAVGHDAFVTSCHGTHQARYIDILGHGNRWPVNRVVEDVEHDLCLLQVEGSEFDPFELAETAVEPRVGDYVAAVGLLGSEINISEGTINALYPYDGAKVIQTDATFRVGESGGALVDRQGRLVGVLTFFAGAPRDYFAMPVRWVRALLQHVDKPIASQSSVPFWQRPDSERPAFLSAVAREFAQDWVGLRDVSARWVEQERENPEAWIALGKAYQRCGQDALAVAVLNAAIRLEPQHPEGWYHLGVAHLNLRDSEMAQTTLTRLQTLNSKVANALRALMTPSP